MARRVLITGASVAGNTAAWWLGHHGCDVTVVERAPDFRDGGQNVDVRGLGREVLRRMGLEKAALENGTGEVGTAWVGEGGKIAARFMLDGKGDGPTAEMEILRGDLARLLYEAAKDQASFRFGDGVRTIEQDDASANVTFVGGGTERFDAVFVAEGVGSSTRDLVFPDENKPRWMDMTIAYCTIPRTATDDRLWRWYNATGGRSVTLRPDTHGTARAMLIVQGARGGQQDWTVARQKAYLHDKFSDVGWDAPRILAGLEDSSDFYFEVLRQVRMPAWAKRRVALGGDAAWCATPLAGMGTTLAIVGAYALAGEVARADDVRAGFAAYERYMRPMVDEGQSIPKLLPRLMNPRSRLGICVLHGALSVASSSGVRAVAAKFADRKAKGPALPDFGAASTHRSPTSAP